MYRAISLCALITLLSAVPTVGQESADGSHTIQGVVQEIRLATADVLVFLFDAETGMPLAKATYKPLDMSQSGGDDSAGRIAVAITDARGRFRFEDVPDGKYRLAAQKWNVPYKGPFELHGGVIRLMGAAEVSVPRPAEEHKALVSLRPPGRGIVRFDQKVGNDATIMLLSTSPLEFDPALGRAQQHEPRGLPCEDERA